MFVDESGFNRGLIGNYGYSRKGVPPTITVDKIKHGNHSAIAALIIGSKPYVEVIEGACNNERFQLFCRNLVSHLKQTLDLRRPCVVIMDNATIHRTGIHEIFWSEHIYLLKTIPYSPQTNPIEMSFNQAKIALQQIFSSNDNYTRTLTKIALQYIQFK